MPIQNGTQDIGTTAVQVDGNFQGWTHIHLRNNDNTKKLFIGNDEVSAANGLTVNGLQTIDFDIPPNDHFCMVAESGTVSVSWLKVNA